MAPGGKSVTSLDDLLSMTVVEHKITSFSYSQTVFINEGDIVRLKFTILSLGQKKLIQSS